MEFRVTDHCIDGDWNESVFCAVGTTSHAMHTVSLRIAWGYGSEALFGSDEAGTASKLYRRHHLLAETLRDIRQITVSELACWRIAEHNNISFSL